MSYLHDTDDADGTATAPEDRWVRCYSCVAGESGGTITITPAGGTAQDPIAVPAGQPFGDTLPDRPAVGGQLGPGSTIAFAGMSSWFVAYR